MTVMIEPSPATRPEVLFYRLLKERKTLGGTVFPAGSLLRQVPYDGRGNFLFLLNERGEQLVIPVGPGIVRLEALQPLNDAEPPSRGDLVVCIDPGKQPGLVYDTAYTVTDYKEDSNLVRLEGLSAGFYPTRFARILKPEEFGKLSIQEPALPPEPPKPPIPTWGLWA